MKSRRTLSNQPLSLKQRHDITYKILNYCDYIKEFLEKEPVVNLLTIGYNTM